MTESQFSKWLGSPEATNQLKQLRLDSLREEAEYGYLECNSFQSGGLNGGQEDESN